MAERCVMCGQPGTKSNSLNNHHYRGKKNYPKDIMRVHSVSCHLYAQWITNLYLLNGRERELTPDLIVKMYQRTILLRSGDDFTLPVYR